MENDSFDYCSETFVHQEAVQRAIQSMPEEEALYDLADLFKNFSDTTRIKILYVLLDNELCVCDIAAVLNVSQSAISHQLRTLKQSKLVKSRRDGKSIFYSLADEHVATILFTGMDHIIE